MLILRYFDDISCIMFDASLIRQIGRSARYWSLSCSGGHLCWRDRRSGECTFSDSLNDFIHIFAPRILIVNPALAPRILIVNPAFSPRVSIVNPVVHRVVVSKCIWGITLLTVHAQVFCFGIADQQFFAIALSSYNQDGCYSDSLQPFKVFRAQVCSGLLSIVWLGLIPPTQAHAQSRLSDLLKPRRTFGVWLTNSPSKLYYDKQRIQTAMEQLQRAGFDRVVRIKRVIEN